MSHGMQGLLPPRQTSLQAEIDKAHTAVARCCTPLEKYQVRMIHHTPCKTRRGASCCARCANHTIACASYTLYYRIALTPFFLLAGNHGIEGVELGYILRCFCLNISKNICLSSTRRELHSAAAWTFALAFQIKIQCVQCRYFLMSTLHPALCYSVWSPSSRSLNALVPAAQLARHARSGLPCCKGRKDCTSPSMTL